MSTTTDDTTSATTQNTQGKRARRPFVRGPRVTAPAVQCGAIDGEPVVFVGLSGKGYQRQMILDANRWPMVVDLWGPSWVLMTDGTRNYAYVASGRVAVAPLSRTNGPAPVALLARLLINAGPDHVVRFGNGDSLDLRDCNLHLLSRVEARHWGPGMDAFLTSLGVTV